MFIHVMPVFKSGKEDQKKKGAKPPNNGGQNITQKTKE
jgi:hypothetical protein